jgi:hypothetical protein
MSKLIKTIIWIDEDYRHFFLEKKLLIGMGYDLINYNSASEAYEGFQADQFNTCKLIIIDVMLQLGENNNLFSDLGHLSLKKVGVMLADKLIEENEALKEKILYFSQATDRKINYPQ